MAIAVEIFKSWHELFLHGNLQSRAEGENVTIVIKARVSGDVINILSPSKLDVSMALSEIMEAIRSDNILAANHENAIKELKAKLSFIMYMPVLLTWIFNGGLGWFYLNWQWNHVRDLVAGISELKDILILLPWILFTLLTLIFGRSFGFKMMKPIVSASLWLINAFRWLRNPKIEKTTD